MKYHKIIIITILFTLVSFTLLNKTSAFTNQELYGGLESYNAIIIEDYNAQQADSEGSLAIGNNMNAPTLYNQTYTVAAAYSGANGQHIGNPFDPSTGPALLLGGNYTNGGLGLFVKGDYTSYTNANNNINDVEVIDNFNIVSQQSIKDHINTMVSEADTYLQEALSFSKGVQIDGSEGYNSSPLAFYLANEDNEINLGVLSDNNGVSNLGEVSIPNNSLDQEATIIYSAATTINLIPGAMIYKGSIVDTNQLFDPESNIAKTAGKVLFYFPNATTINLNKSSLIGSVFAPKAHLIADGGAINGQAILKSVDKKGGFEFHNFLFNWRRKLQTGSIEIIKKDAETNQLLSNVTFKLSDSSNQVIGSYTTDNNGYVKIENLEYGKYYISEIVAPSGYQTNNDIYEIIIDAQNANHTINIENTKIIGSIKIIKVDQDTDTLLAGLNFELYDSNNTLVASKTTNNEGVIIFDNLPFGTYTLKETNALDGYEPLTQTIEINITDNNLITYTISNKKINLGQIEIIKVNGLDNPLSGAVYEIKDLNNVLIDTQTSGVDGIVKFIDLPYGDYQIIEIQAPIGFTLDSTPKYVTINNELQNISFTHYNEDLNTGPTLGNIRILKLDEDTKALLADAIFELENTDNNATYQLVTDNNGLASVSSLPFGNYTLKEISAPDGYEFEGKEVSFVLNQFTFTYFYTFENKILNQDNKVEINKYDALNNKPLAGAIYQIKNVDTNQTFELTSDTDGYALLSNLPHGSYEMIEIKAPDGYQNNNTIYYFEISNTINEIVIDVPNDQLEKEITIIKHDKVDNHILLEGIVFNLYTLNDQFITSATTDVNGYLNFENLDYNLLKAKLVEVKTNDDYILLKEPIILDLSNNDATDFHFHIANTKKDEIINKPEQPNIIIDTGNTIPISIIITLLCSGILINKIRRFQD